jgi:hypothetical protein
MRGKESRNPEQKFEAAFGTIFRFIMCFQRSKQGSIKQAKNSKIIRACTESIDLILQALKKYLSGDPVPLSSSPFY